MISDGCCVMRGEVVPSLFCVWVGDSGCMGRCGWGYFVVFFPSGRSLPPNCRITASKGRSSSLKSRRLAGKIERGKGLTKKAD